MATTKFFNTAGIPSLGQEDGSKILPTAGLPSKGTRPPVPQTKIALFKELYQQQHPDTKIYNSCTLFFPWETQAGVSSYENQAQIFFGPGRQESEFGSDITVGATCALDSSAPKFGNYCLDLTQSTGLTTYVHYQNTNTYITELISSLGDPFSIEFWMKIDYTSGFQNFLNYPTPSNYNIVCFGDGSGDMMTIFLETLSSTTARMYFYLFETSPASGTIYVKSTALDFSTTFDGGWHHYMFAKYNDTYKWWVDGLDYTDPAASYWGDNIEFKVVTDRFRFGRYGILQHALCYLDEFKIDIGKENVSYDMIEPILGFEVKYVPTESQFPEVLKGISTTPARGYADKLLVMREYYQGLCGLNSNGDILKTWSMFQDKVKLLSTTVPTGYMHCNNYSNIGGDLVTLDYGIIQTPLILGHEYPFDYLECENMSATDFEIGEKITGDSSGCVGRIIGAYENGAGTLLYLFLNQISAIKGDAFEATEEIEGQDSGATADVVASVVTLTQYDYFETKCRSKSVANSAKHNYSKISSIVDVRRLHLTYPSVALMAIEIVSQMGLTRIPKINVICERLTKVDGSLYYYDGSTLVPFTADFQNPAHVCWDILTDGFYDSGTQYGRGYGLGVHPKNLDFDSFDAWADYCDELVDIPGGALTQKRCQINIVFDEKDKKGPDSLDKVCTVGRARLDPVGTKYYATIKQPNSAVQNVNSARIVEASYKTEWFTDDSKPDQVIIEFTNEDNYYLKDSVSYMRPDFDDTTDILHTLTVFIPGVTNKDQALREAILRLQLARAFLRRHYWTMSVDGIRFAIGDVIRLQSPSNRLTFGGIVQSIATLNVYLGQTIYLASELYEFDEPTLYYHSKDDDVSGSLVITGPFDTDTDYVTVSDIGALSEGDSYGIARADIEADYLDADFDLVEITEINIDSDQQCSIVGINYPGEAAYCHDDYDSGSTPI